MSAVLPDGAEVNRDAIIAMVAAIIGYIINLIFAFTFIF